MTIDMRRELTPVEFIRQLFAEMKDSKVSIDYHPFFDGPYTMTYELDWTEQDVDKLVLQYETLINALTRIGKNHEALEDESNRQKMLTAEQQEIWNTYMRPFDPFDGDLEWVSVLEFRRETETLEDEDYELLERHYQWYEDNCLQRLPFVKNTPTLVINRAKRYERLIQLDAPQTVVLEEGRCLAEELVLYYHEVKRPAQKIL